MTSPLTIIPDVVRGFAQDQMSSAGGFMAAPAPPPPGDDGDDPTKGATGEFTDNVHRARTTLKQRSDRHADGMTTSATMLEAQDQQSSQAVSAIAPKDQAAMFTGVTKDLMGAATGGIKDVLGAVTSTLQTMTAAGGAALTAGVTAGTTAAAAGAKMGAGGGAALSPGIGGAAPIAGGGGSSDDDKRAATRPASGSPAPSGVSPSPGGAGYVHPGNHDDTEVRQAGFAMPGGSALGAMGGHSGGDSVAKASKTARIVTGTEPVPEVEDPPTGPIDPRVLQRAIASI